MSAFFYFLFIKTLIIIDLFAFLVHGFFLLCNFAVNSKKTNFTKKKLLNIVFFSCVFTGRGNISELFLYLFIHFLFSIPTLLLHYCLFREIFTYLNYFLSFMRIIAEKKELCSLQLHLLTHMKLKSKAKDCYLTSFTNKEEMRRIILYSLHAKKSDQEI